MATDTGLFGPTPWEVQQAQNQSMDDYTMSFAKLSPFEKAGMLMGKAGAGIAGAVAPMLGGVNVAQQQAAQNQQALQGADTSSPEGLIQLAQKVKDFNPSLALQLVAKAKAMEKDQADINYKNAQAKKAENYRAPGSQDPETIKLLDRMTELESLGLQESAEYKALEGRVKFLQTAKGGASGNAKTTQLVPMADGYMHRVEKGIGGKSEIALDENGKPMSVAQYDITLKSGIAQAVAGAKYIGEVNSKAQEAIPDLETSIEQATYLGEQLFAHPGFKLAVGMGVPEAMQASGTSEKGFMALHNQIVRSSFLQAAQQMRGLGQLTEIEGKKAEGAVNRMDTATSESDYRKAYDDYIKFMKMGLEKLRKKAGMTFNMPQVSAPSNAAPMPQGVTLQTPVAPMPSGDGGKADQVAIYRQEYKNAQNKFATAQTPQDQARVTDYIAGLRREAQRLGISLEGENYPTGAASPPVEKWQRIGGKLVKVRQ